MAGAFTGNHVQDVLAYTLNGDGDNSAQLVDAGNVSLAGGHAALDAVVAGTRSDGRLMTSTG